MTKVLVEIRGGNVIYTAFTGTDVELVIIDHDNATTNREQAVPEVNLLSDPEIDKYIQAEGYTEAPFDGDFIIS